MSNIKESAQSAVGLVVSVSPIGGITGTIGKVSKWVVLGLIILLLIIAISLFATKNVGGGVWVLGAGIAIGSFYWYLSRDLCAGATRMWGMGEFSGGSEYVADDAPIEHIDELDDSLVYDRTMDDLKPYDWEGFKSKTD